MPICVVEILHSPLIGLTGVISAVSEDKRAKLDVWELIVAAGVVVGLAAGLQQLVSWLGRRRFAEAEEKVLETVARTLDAEAAERDVAKYAALRESLRRQVEDEVPIEARRVYLRSRLDDLRTRIGEEVGEFEDVARQLSDLEGRQAEPLDERLRVVVEGSIRPGYVQRRRNERVLFAMLAVLVVATLSPIGPGRLLGGSLGAILENADASSADMAIALSTGSVLAVLLAAVVSPRFTPRLRRIKPRSRLWLASVACGVVAIALGSAGALESVRATRLDSRSFEGGSYNERLGTRAQNVEATAAALLGLGLVAVFLSASLGLNARRLQRELGARRDPHPTDASAAPSTPEPDYQRGPAEKPDQA